MDGVVVHEDVPIPGADRFVARLRRNGLDLPDGAIWTSALATAQFLAQQHPAERRSSSARRGSSTI